MTRRFNTMPWGLRQVIRKKGTDVTLMLKTIDYQGKYTAGGRGHHDVVIYPCDYHLYEAI